jgi:hypothetical protein
MEKALEEEERLRRYAVASSSHAIHDIEVLHRVERVTDLDFHSLLGSLSDGRSRAVSEVAEYDPFLMTKIQGVFIERIRTWDISQEFTSSPQLKIFPTCAHSVVDEVSNKGAKMVFPGGDGLTRIGKGK